MKSILYSLLLVGIVSMEHKINAGKGCCQKNTATKQVCEQQQTTAQLDHPVKVRYTNYKGETAIRTIVPMGKPYWGKTEFHPEEQWLIEVWDLERNATRIYALKDVKEWDVQETKKS